MACRDCGVWAPNHTWHYPYEFGLRVVPVIKNLPSSHAGGFLNLRHAITSEAMSDRITPQFQTSETIITMASKLKVYVEVKGQFIYWLVLILYTKQSHNP